MPAVRHGDPSTTYAGTTRFAIVAKRLDFVKVVGETVGLAEWIGTQYTPKQPTGLTYLGGIGTITGTIVDTNNDPVTTSYEVWYRLIAVQNWSLGPVVPMEFDGTTAYDITNLASGSYNLMIIASNGDWKAKPWPPSLATPTVYVT